MAFDVKIADGVVLYIIRCEELTTRDRVRILDGITEELGRAADRFFEQNLIPGSQSLFWYDFILVTDALVVREFRFICNSEGHVYGVTEVQYLEESFEDNLGQLEPGSD